MHTGRNLILPLDDFQQNYATIHKNNRCEIDLESSFHIKSKNLEK